jgi:acetate kinase
MLTSAHPILVINNGSSSLKFSVLDPKSETLLSSGLAERIGTEQGSLKMTDLKQEKHEEKLALADHRSALLRVIEILSESDRFDCKAIGHRVVHGGEYFHDPVLVTDSVLQKIEELTDLAPLHNPANALGIRVVEEVFPGKPQVAVFDTAFHQTLPPYAFHYAIPYELYEKYRIRRYGFHGTSHHYVTVEAARRLGKPYDQMQLISAHLGNGCSATAVKNGQSVDTTMGLTPLEGLVMGTRSGDVDPSLLLFLQEHEGLSLVQIIELLTRKSGLLGVSGVSHDMRSVVTAADGGNPRAKLAIDIFCHRLGRAILGLASSLTSIDALIFTGGIGENSAFIRSKVLSQLGILHPEIDPKLNDENGKQSNGRITTTKSGLLCLVIPTNEELMIARETDRLIP